VRAFRQRVDSKGEVSRVYNYVDLDSKTETPSQP
jgi:hypothetical protein